MWRHLRYLIWSLRYPECKDFVRGGLGIEARARRCARYWKPHLDLSRSFIQRTLEGSNPSTLLVLGAGRLLDMPLDSLPPSVRSVHLLDLDPSALPTWRQIKAKLLARGVTVDFQLEDVTGRLSSWSAALKAESRKTSPDRLSRALEALRHTRPSHIPLPDTQYDLVISLNILSQLGLYWEDRLQSAFPGCFDSHRHPLTEPLTNSLRETMALLESEHLALLERLTCRDLIILCDEFFHYYTCTQSEWQSDAALHIPFPPEFSTLNLQGKDQWWWHLAPQWLEGQAYGELHSVIAFHFQRGQGGNLGADRVIA